MIFLHSQYGSYSPNKLQKIKPLVFSIIGGIQSKEINGGAKNIDLENKNNHILL